GSRDRASVGDGVVAAVCSSLCQTSALARWLVRRAMQECSWPMSMEGIESSAAESGVRSAAAASVSVTAFVIWIKALLGLLKARSRDRRGRGGCSKVMLDG